MVQKEISSMVLRALAGVATLVASGCHLDQQVNVCGDTTVPAPTGEITQGKAAPEQKVPGPVTFRGTLHSKRAVDLLTIGGVPAAETGAASNFTSWTVTLQPADLEANRVPGTDTANIRVLAYTVCEEDSKEGILIAETKLTIGPNPNLPVTGLHLDTQFPNGECYLPMNGGASATVNVLADPLFVGAKVFLQASQEKLSAASVDLQADDKGMMSWNVVTFAPTKAGVATLIAYGVGAPSEPEDILVVAAPTMSAPGNELVRDNPYSLFASSRGNLDTCVIEASSPGTTTFKLVEPNVGDVSGSISVKEPTLDCSAVETLRFEVTFLDATPDGAQVTLRCSDTFQQEGTITVKVKDKPEPPADPDAGAP